MTVGNPAFGFQYQNVFIILLLSHAVKYHDVIQLRKQFIVNQKSIWFSLNHATKPQDKETQSQANRATQQVVLVLRCNLNAASRGELKRAQQRKQGGHRTYSTT